MARCRAPFQGRPRPASAQPSPFATPIARRCCAARRAVSRCALGPPCHERRQQTPERCPTSRSRNAEKECAPIPPMKSRSEEHTSELQSPCNLVCRLLLEKKKK